MLVTFTDENTEVPSDKDNTVSKYQGGTLNKAICILAPRCLNVCRDPDAHLARY